MVDWELRALEAEARMRAVEAERDALRRKLRGLCERIESIENTRVTGLSPNRRKWFEIRDAARVLAGEAAPPPGKRETDLGAGTARSSEGNA